MSSFPPEGQLDRLGPPGEDCAPSGTEGEAPTATEAPAATDAPVATDAEIEEHVAGAAEQAPDDQQQADRRARHDKRSRKRQEIRADLQFMVAANRQAGGQGVYTGFRFVRTGVDVSPDEESYLGTFLPLDVARKYPNLLAFTTIGYEDVFVNEGIEPGTRMVVGPGQFRPYRGGSFARQLISSPALWVYALVAAVALAGLAMWLTG